MFSQSHIRADTKAPVEKVLSLAPVPETSAKAALATLPSAASALSDLAPSVGGAQRSARSQQRAHMGAESALHRARFSSQKGAQGGGARTAGNAHASTGAADSSPHHLSLPHPPSLSGASDNSITWTVSATAPCCFHPYGCLTATPDTGDVTIAIKSRTTHEGIRYTLTVITSDRTDTHCEQVPFRDVAIALSNLCPQR